jgi:hypothetical protein
MWIVLYNIPMSRVDWLPEPVVCIAPSPVMEIKSPKLYILRAIKVLFLSIVVRGRGGPPPSSLCKYFISLWFIACKFFVYQKRGASWVSRVATVGSATIFLGALPCGDQDWSPLGPSCCIVSCVEAWERSGLCTMPVRWEGNRQVTCIDAPDFQPLSIEQIGEGVAAIRAAMLRGQNVYAHCKAGHGRSVSILLAFLAFEKGIDSDDALMRLYLDMKIARPTINLSARQMAQVKAFLRSIVGRRWAETPRS